MVLSRIQSLTAMLAAMSLTHPMLAATSAPLLAVSTGEFHVNGAAVRGSATVLPGQSVRTSGASSRINVQGGQVELEPRSLADYGAGVLRLREGTAEVRSSADAGLEALGLRVAPAKSASARVQMQGEDTVLVAAAGGPVNIYNGAGLLVASLDPGMARWLTPAPAQAESSQLTGCLRLADGKFFLNDPVTNTTVELRGPGLESNVNKTVQVTGTPFRTATPAPGASQVIRVSAVSVVANACKGPGSAPAKPTPAAKGAPKAAAPSNPAPAKTSTSMSNGAKIGIAVAVIGGGAGTAAAFALKGDSSSR